MLMALIEFNLPMAKNHVPLYRCNLLVLLNAGFIHFWRYESQGYSRFVMAIWKRNSRIF